MADDDRLMPPETEVRVLDQAAGERWQLWQGDCVQVLRGVPDESVDFTVYSPPFASLYTYSASPLDMGNCRDGEEFVESYQVLAHELHRVTRPGRLCSVHSMMLPASKVRDGYIGIHDFRGDLIRCMQRAGWVLHSEVTIWKDPVTAMQRTKALGLLHKQVKKDSCMSRQGIPDYLTTFRRLGENERPVSHTDVDLPVELWQRYASPVWMDIDPSDTLQHRSAREEEDERHICPLQLEVTRRALHLWSREGDVVLSPFAGIGSELVVALEQGRRAIGVELKRSYYEQARANLTEAESAGKRQIGLFGGAA